MEPLSSFALGLAVNHVYSFIKLNLKNAVKKEIDLAFESALKRWSKHEVVAKKRYELRGILSEKYDNGEEVYSNLNNEQREFFQMFNEELCAKQQAYNFLAAITSERFYKETKASFKSIEQNLNNIGDDVADIKEMFNNHSELKKEWEDQLIVYKELLEEYKPNTALKLVEALEQRLQESDLNDNPILDSKIQYLKSLCYEISGQAKEANLAIVKAFELQRDNKLYEERACLAYYFLGDPEKAQELSQRVLDSDSFNIRANAAKVLLNVAEFSTEIRKVSLVVQDNLDFRRILYVALRNHDDMMSLCEAFPKMVLSDRKIELFDISYDSFKVNTYLMEIGLNNFLRNTRIEFYGENNDDGEILKASNSLIKPYVESIVNTEIHANFKQVEFFSKYIEYLIDSSNANLSNLRQVYEDIKDAKNEYVCVIMANVLQKLGEDKEAVKILDEFGTYSHNILNLKLYCTQKNQDHQSFLDAANKKVEITSQIGYRNIEDILRVIRMLGYNKQQSEFKFDELLSKNFETEELKTFLNIYWQLWTKGRNKDYIQSIKLIGDDLVRKSSLLSSYVQEAHFMNEEFSYSAEIFEKNESDFNSPLDISHYIDSLITLKTNNTELLKWLEYWRRNFDFDERYTRVEISKVAVIGDWKKCNEICNYALEHKIHEDFVLYFGISCYHLDDKELFESRLGLFCSHDYGKAEIALQIVNLLYHFEYFEEGLELNYIWAKEKNNKLARTQFFMSFIKTSINYFEDFEIIGKGHFVRYQINDSPDFYIKEVTDDEFSTQLIGAKTGDNIEVKRSFGQITDTIHVGRICNKFLSLKLEIMDETKNPQSGLDMQSFNILDYESPLDIFKDLIPDNGEQDDPYEMYYSDEITFSHLPFYATELNKNFVRAYYSLIYDKKGVVRVDPRLFPSFPVQQEYEFVLDFSSLLHFFELSRKESVKFSAKFKLSSFLFGLIKSYREDALHYWSSEKYNLNEEFYVELENWIRENCDVVSPVTLLDIIGDNEIKQEPLYLYLLNQVAMIQEYSNSLMITDDLFFYKMYPLDQMKLISTDMYKLRESVKNQFLNT